MRGLDSSDVSTLASAFVADVVASDQAATLQAKKDARCSAVVECGS